MTAFSNSLPSKIIPKIMRNESLSCDIAKDVNFCYIFLIDSEMYGNQLDYLSRVNHFYSALDFFADILDIQKIKSSYSYYICCTGAQQYLQQQSFLPEQKYMYQHDATKLLLTFSLLAHQIAETLGIKLSSGVTRGDIVIGAISLSSQIINFDTYGDTINTAARIARNNKSGCYIALHDFVGGFFS